MKETKKSICTCNHEIPVVRNTGKQLRAAVYCRVSTDSFAQSSSLEMQQSALRKKLQKIPGVILTDIYADQGKSGGSRKNRNEFNRMLHHCQEGRIDLILTKNISRFGRNLADTTAVLCDLKKYGIPVFFEKENLNTSDPSAELIISVLTAIAQEELNTHSQNIKWALRQKARLGKPGRKVCYGYRKRKDGRWAVCEPEARRIQLIFQMAEQELLYEELLKKLNQLEQEEGSSYVWNKNKAYRILKKEEYIGDVLTYKSLSVDYMTHKQIKNNGVDTQYYVRHHHEPIIDRQVYEKVPKILKKRRRCKKNEIVYFQEAQSYGNSNY